MKILLLSSFPINEMKLELNNCKSRFDLYLYLIYNYLSKYNNEIYIHTFINKHINHNILLANKIYPQVDHVILIENYGFKNMKSYVNKLRESTTGLICSFSLTNMYLYTEDTIFYTIPSISSANSLLLNYITDDILITSEQTFDGMDILLGDTYMYKNNINPLAKNDITHSLQKLVLEFVIRNIRNTNIRVTTKKSYGFETYTMDVNKDIHRDNINITDFITNTQKIQKYTDFYNTYAKTNIFFVTHPMEDIMLLFELAMSNVLIVAPTNYVDPYLVNLLNISTYNINKYSEYSIPWRDIIAKLNNFNIRDTLIQNGFAFSIGIEKINDYLEKNTVGTKMIKSFKEITSDELNNSSNNNSLINEQQTNKNNKLIHSIINTVPNNIDKSYIHNLTNDTNQTNQTNVIKRPIKKIILQNNLRNINQTSI